MFALGLWDASAIIRHGQSNTLVCFLQHNFYLRPNGSVPQTILDQIGDHL